jgi:hypothetical protein
MHLNEGILLAICEESFITSIAAHPGKFSRTNMRIGWMDHTVAQGSRGDPMPCISETDGMSWNHERVLTSEGAIRAWRAG